MSQSTSVGVVVVNYNSAALVERSLDRCDFDSTVRVVIVDNSDDDLHRHALAESAHDKDWVVVDAGGNRGFGSGANSGISTAAQLGCEAVLLLNPDAWILRDDFATLLATHRQHPTALITPVVRQGDGRIWFDGGVITRSGRAAHASTDSPDWLSAACLLVPLGSSLPQFWTGYFLYWEDVDFTSRWKRDGGELLVDRRATAFHDVGGTQASAKPGKSTTYVRYSSRNRLVFAARNLGGRTFVWWVLLTPLFARRMVRVARDGWARASWAALVGSASGVILGMRALALRGGTT